MYAVVEDVTRETIDDPGERDREVPQFYRHGCGDHAPIEVLPP